MDDWINIVIRQLILYSLPVLISLTMVVFIESRLSKTSIPHPFFAVSWKGTWLPLLASLALHRGIIIALPNPLPASPPPSSSNRLPNSQSSGVKTAIIRCLAHALLSLLGLFVFSWSLAHSAPTGLPPLHHWWAKVLMFFNLCMVCLHLVPLPGLVAGECLLASRWGNSLRHYFNVKHNWIVLTLLAASPLLDIGLGGLLVFPVYESMSNMATYLSH